MKMSSPISPRDFELISAYLDGQLQGTARQRLEARLAHESALLEEFHNLQRMRSVLRSLPRVRAPRNFTLTPQMVGQRKAQSAQSWLKLSPAFGFASALASLLFVLVVLGEVLGFLPGSKQQAEPLLAMEANAPSTEVALQAAPQAADSGLSVITEEPALKFALETPTAEEPSMELKVAPEGTEDASLFSESTPGLAQGSAGPPPTENVAGAAELAQPASFPTETPLPAGGGILDPDLSSSAKILGDETPTPTLTFTPTPPPTETPVPTPPSTETPVPTPTDIMPTMVEPTEAVPTPTQTLEPSPTQEVLALALPSTEEAVGAEAGQADQLMVTEDNQRDFLPAPAPTLSPVFTPRIMLLGIQFLLLSIAVVTGLIALYLRFRDR